MIDILGVVYDFVREFAWRKGDLPRLLPEQVLRGWQNTGTLPAHTTEFCVMTLLRSQRHGTPANIPRVGMWDYKAQIFSLTEHVIQLDFCSAEPYVNPQASKLRADLLNMICFSPQGSAFFQRADPSLNCMYADDVSNNGFFDTDKLYSARYSVQIHISEQQHTNLIKEPSFNSVTLQTGRAGTAGQVDKIKDVDPFFKASF